MPFVPDETPKDSATSGQALTGKFVPNAPPPTATQPAGALERIGTGMADPVHGLAQLIYHLAPESVTKNVDAFNNWLVEKGLPIAPIPERGLDVFERRREESIQKEGPGKGKIDWWRLLGNVASPVNLAPVGAMGKAATGAERLAQATGAGLFSGAAEPVTEGSYWKEKAKQAAGGAAAGTLGGVVGEAVGRAIAPKFDPDVQALLDLGVSMTPGQMAGGGFRRLEDALTSVPVLGQFIRQGQNRSVESFNKAAIDMALDPIGQKLPWGTKIGREAIEKAESLIGDAYDNILPKMVFKSDPEFLQGLQNLRALVQEMPETQAKQFENIFQNRVLNRLDPNGVMLGDTMKQVESELSSISRGYKSSSDAAQRQLSDALDEIRNLMRQNMTRNNPAEAAELEKINSAYAKFVRLQKASTQKATSGGVFTPSDLSRAVQQMDPSVRKARTARGGALMQNISDPASVVLPQAVRDSGTAERLLSYGLLGGSTQLNPWVALGAFGAATPYTSLGMSALNQWARLAPQQRAAVRQAVEAGYPYATPGAGVLGADLVEAILPPKKTGLSEDSSMPTFHIQSPRPIP
jgi:hypothetical protein